MEFNVLSVVQLVGGLALFIYGMTTMGKGLERAAGSKLEKTLEKMTGNVFKAVSYTHLDVYKRQSWRSTSIYCRGWPVCGRIWCGRQPAAAKARSARAAPAKPNWKPTAAISAAASTS